MAKNGLSRAGMLRRALHALCLALAMLGPGPALAQAPETYPGMPPVPDRANVYSETGSDHMSDAVAGALARVYVCLLYTSPSPRDRQKSRMPSSA